MNLPVDPSGAPLAAPLADRLARLNPQQRALLLRQLAARGATPAATAASTPHARVAAGMALPLSPAQQRIWFFERLQPGTGAYHIHDHHRLRGALDVAALERAFAAVVQRHDALRTAFDEVEGQARQTVSAVVDFAVTQIDLSGLSVEDRDAQLQHWIDTESDRPFNLACAPLLRVTLLRLAADDHALLVVIHHIISDAWSMGVLQREFTQCYNAYVANQMPVLAPLGLQFGDAVLWHREPQQEQQVEDQLAFWQHALAGSTGLLDLPTDHPRTASVTARGARLTLGLPRELAAGVADLARREGATLFMALLAAFQALLARYSGETDIVVGSPVANRSATEFEPLIGLFVNTLALRGDLGGDPSFRLLLARTRARCLDALEHAQAPLERVIDRLQLERVAGRPPLFQTMFVLQNAEGTRSGMTGLSEQWIEPTVHTARFELTLSLGESAHGFEGVLDYDSDLFDAATAARMVEHYQALLRGFVAQPDCAMSRIALLADEEVNDLLTLGDGGPALAAEAPTLYELFERQAARAPHATALVEPGRELSYEQLRLRANGVAQRLQDLGVGPQTQVAVLTDRSIESVIAVLGVLAAGGAYVPLDPGHPDERLTFLLGDAAARVLIAPPGLRDRALRLATTVALLVSADAPSAASAPAVTPGDRHAAYVIYTSGSTGTPKGVVVEHRGAVNLVQGFLARHDFRDQRLLMIPPLVFDASVGDVFPVLACGSALVLHPAPAELGPFELERFCVEHGVTAIDAPAALWRRWSEGWSSVPRSGPLLPSLRMMMIGGESVPVEQVRRFAATTDHRVSLCNHYGPTEASVCATMLATVDGTGIAWPELSIGTPLPGVRVYVLDSHLALAPRGVAGELCIGGRGVARGYRNAAALTDECFIADPYAGEPGARFYRTGDLARWNVDGSLQFLGRRDHQVKLRGFRIELGEIDAALASCAGVQGAVAAIREDRPGDRRLVAYVVVEPTLTMDTLRAHLAQRLPEVMLPTVFVSLPALPLTSNGKIDRRALPVPSDEQRGQRPHRAPTTATEHAVLAVWRDVLGRDELGIDDEFFAVGGDSLLSLPLVFKLHAALGVEVALASVFATPTIAGLARTIDEIRAGTAVDVLDLASQVLLADEIHPRHAGPARAPRATPGSVLLTGATGYLGAYVVRELLDASAAEIVCLVRADSADEGLRRIRANLESYGQWRTGDEARLVPLPGDLALPRLGLSEDAFAALAGRVDAIIHNGGQVNFLAPYASLAAANVDGTQEVLRLATTAHVKPVQLVSTLGVYLIEENFERTVRESDPPPPGDAQGGGYNQSKWVSEQLGLLARDRGLPVAIHRPARITGDSRTGVSNLGDYFNAWIKGCVQLGLAPHLPEEVFDMAPIDYVARALVQITLGAGEANGNYHYFNPHTLPVPEAIAALRAAGYALETVDYPQWRTALVAAATAGADNALKPFAGLFPPLADARMPHFDCSATAAAVGPLGTVCAPANRDLFDAYLRFLQARGFLPSTDTVSA